MARDIDAYNEYHRVYQLERYHRRRAEAIRKLGGKCAICGSEDNLEIDHIDYHTKSFNLAKMWSANEVDFQNEISKCQVLCRTHHMEKSVEEISEMRGGCPHGKSYTMAFKLRCECDLCQGYRDEFNRLRREKRRQRKSSLCE